jgi:hypothetical protein
MKTFIDVTSIVCMICFICVYLYTYIKCSTTKKRFCLYLLSINDFEILNLLEKKYTSILFHLFKQRSRG